MRPHNMRAMETIAGRSQQRTWWDGSARLSGGKWRGYREMDKVGDETAGTTEDSKKTIKKKNSSHFECVLHYFFKLQ